MKKYLFLTIALAICLMGSSFIDHSQSNLPNTRLIDAEVNAFEKDGNVTLTVTSPVNGLITSELSVIVQGSTNDNDNRVKVNGVRVTVNSNGSFSKSVTLVEGVNTITVEATDDDGENRVVITRIVNADRTSPVLTVYQPTDGIITNTSNVTVTGKAADFTNVVVKVNGSQVTVDGAGNFSTTVSLTEGSNQITVEAKDAVSNVSTVTRNVTRDTQPPVLTLSAPVNGYITNQSTVTVTGQVTDGTQAAVKVNGVSVTVDSSGSFTKEVTLVRGLNNISVTAEDAAGNTSLVERTVRLDDEAPEIVITEPIEGITVEEELITVAGVVIDSTTVTLLINSELTQLNVDGSFSRQIVLIEGLNTIQLNAVDAANNETNRTVTVTYEAFQLPPDPVAVAPKLDSTVVTTVGDATEFLYTGTNPIQTGVDSGTIEKRRVNVIRGKVLSKDFQPLSGAEITILNHPEYGQTLSRRDGMFDMAVNGGGYITVNYKKEGYLTAQRNFKTEWQDYSVLDSVVLIQLDPNVTEIVAADTIQVARGSIETDIDGIRQATMLFKPGTQGTMVLSDGSQMLLTNMNVRATEYTVGEAGRAAMPAELPANVAYTYCVELSVDEAIDSGAVSVVFNKPVPLYAENFLEFPVGIKIPVGYYERNECAKWVPSDNGLTIKIVDIIDNKAQIDMTGDDIAEGLSELAAIGIDTLEQVKLAELYAVGTTLWRAELKHLTPYDFNHPYLTPDDADNPNVEKPESPEDEKDDDDCKEDGSIIGAQDQSLGQAVGITGTGMALYYQSERMLGRSSNLNIQLSTSSMPASVSKILLEVSLAGRRFKYSFSPQQNLSYEFKWDRKDAYGRLVYGAQDADIKIGYVYLTRLATRAEAERVFNQYGVAAINTRIRESDPNPVTFWTGYSVRLSGVGKHASPIAGWTLDINHSYDPNFGSILYGNGNRRGNNLEVPVIKTIYAAPYDRGVNDMIFDEKGNIYFIEEFDIYRRNTDGTIDLILAGAGGGGGAGIAAGSPALMDVTYYYPVSIALGKCGAIYFSDLYNSCIRKIDSDGNITTVAGTGNYGFSGDGGLAVDAQIGYVYDITFAPDGSLYFVDKNYNRIRKISTDGYIYTVAGSDSYGFSGDGGFVSLAQFDEIRNIAFADDGTLYINDWYNRRIRKVDTDGTVSTFVGNGQYGSYINGANALETALGNIINMAVGKNGELYLLDDQVATCITPDGKIVILAGGGNLHPLLEDVPAKSIPLYYALDYYDVIPSSIAIGTDGFLYISQSIFFEAIPTDIFEPNDSEILLASIGGPNSLPADFEIENGFGTIKRIYSPLPTNKLIYNDYAIASEDGSQLFIFSRNGKHLRTVNALNNKTIYEFVYDTLGLLSKVIDIDSLVTQINWDGTKPLSIVSPFGQITDLTVNSNGYIENIINPASDTLKFAYTSTGMMTGMLDSKNNLSTYYYDLQGRLIKAVDAVGGEKLLSRAKLPNGHEVTFTTPEKLTKKYRVENLSDGTRRLTNTDSGGLQVVTSQKQDGSTVTLYPDGTTVLVKTKADPRFGLQVPLADYEVKTPSGLTLAASQTREITKVVAEKIVGITDGITVNGKTAVSLYDGELNKITTTTPMGKQGYSYLDTLGRVIRTEVPGIEPVTYTYNDNGFLTEAAQGTRKSTFVYNALGRLESVTDPMNRTESMYYDSVGRITKQVLNDGREINYTYDANGNLTSITPPGRPAHTFDYTPVDLTDEYTPPVVPDSAGGTKYFYNLDQQLTAALLPDGSTINIVYDTTGCGCSGAGKPKYVIFDRGTLSYQYSPLTGQLTSVTAPDSTTIDYYYDGSLPVKVEWSGIVNGSISVTYNNDFKPVSQSINNANTINYAYDNDGMLTQAGDLAVNYNTQNGMLTGTVLDSITTAYTYNTRGEVTAYNTKYGTNNIYNTAYAHDTLGRITQIAETIEGVTDTYTYTYNTYGYLTEVKKNGVTRSLYTYDANGNRTSAVINGVTDTAVYDAQDRMLTYGNAAYVYTKKGDLRYKIEGTDTTKYYYDNMGNLITVNLPNGDLIEYIIDANNNRVGKKLNGETLKKWLYQNQFNIVAELNNLDSVTMRYVYGTQENVPEYLIKNNIVFKYITDHLGSVRMVVNTITGEIAQRIDYDEYGNIVLNTNPSFQPFAYVGGIYDEDTKLIRFGFRDYDPSTGRWADKDPLGFASPDDNLYIYVDNDPINLSDFYGLSWEKDVQSFTAGLLDEITFGGTGLLFDAIGIKIDKCSGWYNAGEWVGFGATVVVGGGAGWKMAAKTVGKEFSHWVPKRILKKFGKKALKFGKTRWNGNYVKPLKHHLHDKFRYVSGGGKKYGFLRSQLSRTPFVYRGIGVGLIWGGSSMYGLRF